ncbi:hypothetical protein C7974DRAFT_393519 [Boeremia exigua]|uniref:uncharacterized protein n=1 Tax=Boeremia exigua TaxID=749465 RepID=UPI001E8E5CE8|nr:uncharacterized protein C7974DRAFT_393519 [Boeremia exigua]KAH6628954.1 hypothetical protein C7974DRAFT_393519 [Boeremia exigua]
MGKHGHELSAGERESSLKVFYASLTVYDLSLGLTKCSIIVKCLRIFPTRRLEVACLLVLAATMIYRLCTVLCSILICLSPRAFWTRTCAMSG